MSLTRAEWEMMWRCAQIIEHEAMTLQTTNKIKSRRIVEEINIK